MAVIWQKISDDTRYEVRTAGRTTRLYTNGVLHTQLNSDQAVTGGVWDALFLPALFYPPGAVRRILVLGVGGGAVINLLLRFIMPEQIVGVDLDAVHLAVARRFFGLRDPRVSLHQADASQWLVQYRGPPFDMIIDDLFGGRAGEPVRAIPADTRWMVSLLSHLTPRGVLVANFASSTAFRECGYFSSSRLARRFSSAFRLSDPRSQNVIGAFLRQETSSPFLRQRLRQEPELSRALSSARLQYHIRRV